MTIQQKLDELGKLRASIEKLRKERENNPQLTDIEYFGRLHDYHRMIAFHEKDLKDQVDKLP